MSQPTIPDHCGFECPHADFPPADTAGICRTMAAVWCGQLKELVNKNAPCEWRQRAATRKPKPAPAPRSPRKRTSRPQ